MTGRQVAFHSTCQIPMTMEIYSHVTDEQTRDALKRLGHLFE
jgi:hypothetical protein